MSLPRYPYQMSNLATQGALVFDGQAVRADHFNRLAREVTIMQGVMGIGVAGGAGNLRVRLSQEMQPDGTFKREVLCEDDPSGNEQGCRRYLDTQWEEINIGTKLASFPLSIAYNAFSEPPVCLFSVMTNGGFDNNADRAFITGNEAWGTRVYFSQINGTKPATSTIRVAWLAISQRVEVYDGERAWIMQPVRAGS